MRTSLILSLLASLAVAVAAPAAADAQAAIATATDSPEAATPAPPPAAAKLPDLPVRAIIERRTHIVPEDDPAPQARPFDIRNSPGIAAQKRAGRPVAAAAGALARRAATPSPARGKPTEQLAGAAEASGATILRVGGRSLRLFGIRPPTSGDRCPAPAGAAQETAGQGNAVRARATQPCLDQAEGVLTARLARKAVVSCRFPVPAGGAICLDGDGVDLAGILVAEGLAVADPAQSYDYVGAETVARSQKRGLWLFR